MNTNPIASDTSWEVAQKQRREQSGTDTPRVKAPAEHPAKFDAYPAVKS